MEHPFTDYLTMDEAAALLGVSRFTAVTESVRHKWRSYHVIGRIHVYLRADVEQSIRRRAERQKKAVAPPRGYGTAP